MTPHYCFPRVCLTEHGKKIREVPKRSHYRSAVKVLRIAADGTEVVMGIPNEEIRFGLNSQNNVVRMTKASHQRTCPHYGPKRRSLYNAAKRQAIAIIRNYSKHIQTQLAQLLAPNPTEAR